jgi:hypothetical protein
VFFFCFDFAAFVDLEPLFAFIDCWAVRDFFHLSPG